MLQAASAADAPDGAGKESWRERSRDRWRWDRLHTTFRSGGCSSRPSWIVKSVMIGLLFASIWVWAIVFDKVDDEYHHANRAADAFEDQLLVRRQPRRPLRQGRRGAVGRPLAAVFGSAMRRWRRSAGNGALLGGPKERVERAMGVTIGREMERLERWMVFLASVGSVAPLHSLVRHGLGAS